MDRRQFLAASAASVATASLPAVAPCDYETRAGAFEISWQVAIEVSRNTNGTLSIFDTGERDKRIYAE